VLLKKHIYFILIFIIIATMNCNKSENIEMNNITIHYHRYDNKYEDWKLWTWVDQYKHEIFQTGRDEYGIIFNLNLSEYPLKGKISILPKYKEWEKKDPPERSWFRSMAKEIWILQDDIKIYSSRPGTNPKIRKTFIDSHDSLTVILSTPVSNKNLKSLSPKIILDNPEDIHIRSISTFPKNADSSNILIIKTATKIDLNKLPGKLHLDGFDEGNLVLRSVLDENNFITNEPLGVFYSPEQTKFSVIIGKYYTFNIDGPDPNYSPDKEVIDPYAKCVTAHNGRGIITNDSTPIAQGPNFPFSQAIIYEIHVRDFTISENSGVKNKGKYLGFAEENTRLQGTDLKTGLDHLKELGINTVQLLPVQDFEHDNSSNNYFWGYMSVNYNSPDGWYATDISNDFRIKEFKTLVSNLHKNGIKVVMDVVYNHTAEGSPQVKFNFNGFAPNYYYRQKIDGAYWNGSGCGNEMRSENPMVRKYIVESLKYWVKEYDIDGFRFDLMGLHDMETMTEIISTLRSIKPDIFIYGEPWTAGNTPITPTIKGTQRGKEFAVFNDHYRDALKGPWYNTEPGYIQTGRNIDAVKCGIMGSIDDFADSPTEVINYTTCHDGRTLWDQLVASTEGIDSMTNTELQAMDKLGAAILFTSQGIPFIHGGQEILRSKFGSHNSYNLPDKINKISWDYKQENLNIFNYYKGLIELRKSHPMFRMTNAKEIRKNLIFFDNTPHNSIAYSLKKGNSNDTWKEVLILINPNRFEVSFDIPQNKWILIVDDKTAGVDIIEPISEEKVFVKAYSVKIMYRL